jgi:hypothetical protein
MSSLTLLKVNLGGLSGITIFINTDMNGKNILKYLFEQEPENTPPPKGEVKLTPEQQKNYDHLFDKYFDGGMTPKLIHARVLAQLKINKPKYTDGSVKRPI